MEILTIINGEIKLNLAQFSICILENSQFYFILKNMPPSEHFEIIINDEDTILDEKQTINSFEKMKITLYLSKS
jgi:hypothetical protein